MSTGGASTGASSSGLGGSEAAGAGLGGASGGSGNAGDAGGATAGAGMAGEACMPPGPDGCDSTRCPSGLPEEATTCAQDVNYCGCGDLTCGGAGEGGAGNVLCVHVRLTPLAGEISPHTDQNVCANDLCSGDADCPDGERCIRDLRGLPVCSTACRFDSECTADCGGRCESELAVAGHAGAPIYDPSQARCLYGGMCDSTSCAGCTPVPTTTYAGPREERHYCD